MPNTNRGYPYETGADQPGHSLTGGSDGASPILAQVIDADVSGIDARTSAIAGARTASGFDVSANVNSTPKRRNTPPRRRAAKSWARICRSA